MAKNQLRDLHLFVIESALPFGMGLIKKAKTGGLKEIMDVFKSKDPFLEFQVNGDTSAKKVRDQIDQLIPGLGHPVVSVDVSVEVECPDHEIDYKDSLVLTLNRIDSQLDKLRCYLSDVSSKIDNK